MHSSMVIPFMLSDEHRNPVSRTHSNIHKEKSALRQFFLKVRPD